MKLGLFPVEHASERTGEEKNMSVLGEFLGSAFNGRQVGQIQVQKFGFLPSLSLKVLDRGLGFLFTTCRDVYLGVMLEESL